jgi:hypothetical protein
MVEENCAGFSGLYALFSPFLSRKDSDGSGSATVPVALVGVSPASRTMILPTLFGAGPKDGRVFGETPKTAVETTALPKATASFRIAVRV